jgi:transposase
VSATRPYRNFAGDHLYQNLHHAVGHYPDWFRDALKDKGIKPCIPGRKSRVKPIKHDKRRYKRRNRIEIMFGRLKYWRRVATRYDRCSKVFLSAIALTATVMFWL